MAALILLVSAGCGALTPARADGGALDGGPGVDGGDDATWLEVFVDAPPGTRGDVQRLEVRPGEVWALLASRYLLRSQSGRFTLAYEIDPPGSFVDARVTTGGAVLLVTPTALLTCFAGCDDTSRFSQVSLPWKPLAACGFGESMEVVLRTPDAGASVYSFSRDAGWGLLGELGIAAARACDRAASGEVYVAGRGAIGRVTDAGLATVSPGTGLASRPAAEEPWAFLVTDGDAVFAASERGALATSLDRANWSVAGGPVGLGALAAGVAVGRTVSRWTPEGWLDAGPVPSALAFVTAAAVDDEGAVWVGGRDAEGAPRIFRRSR